MLPILYQDEHLVAIDKPSGLLVHRKMIDKRETQFALQMTRDQIVTYSHIRLLFCAATTIKREFIVENIYTVPAHLTLEQRTKRI